MPIAMVNLIWCVVEMYVIYKWDNFITKMGRPMRSIQHEMRIELEKIVGALNLRAILDRYQLGWMTIPRGSYSQGIVHKFLESYAAFLDLTTPRGGRGVVQPRLESTLVREVLVDILGEAIHWVVYRLDYLAPTSIAECDYRLRSLQERCSLRDVDNKRQSLDLARWISNLVTT